MSFRTAQLLAAAATLIFFALIIGGNIQEITNAYGEAGAAYFNAALGALAATFAIGFGRRRK